MRTSEPKDQYMGIGSREVERCAVTTCHLFRQIVPQARAQTKESQSFRCLSQTEWCMLFRGVFSAVHFVTPVIGGEVAMAIFAADRFVLHCCERVLNGGL